jgi:hypothetical protein
LRWRLLSLSYSFSSGCASDFQNTSRECGNASPSAWHQVSDDDEILGTADSRERAEARQCHVRGPSTVFERLRKTTKPRTVRAGKRYKKRWWWRII